MRVLVVDDDVTLCQAISGALEAAGGFEVRVAYNGTEAIDIISHDELDVILLDINLDPEGLSGWDVARYQLFHHDAEVRDIQIIICSGLSPSALRSEGYDVKSMQKMSPIIVGKPVDFDALVSLLRRYEKA